MMIATSVILVFHFISQTHITEFSVFIKILICFYFLFQVELPKKEIVLSRRDDAAIYDDGSQGQDAFKDDHK